MCDHTNLLNLVCAYKIVRHKRPMTCQGIPGTLSYGLDLSGYPVLSLPLMIKTDQKPTATRNFAIVTTDSPRSSASLILQGQDFANYHWKFFGVKGDDLTHLQNVLDGRMVLLLRDTPHRKDWRDEAEANWIDIALESSHVPTKHRRLA